MVSTKDFTSKSARASFRRARSVVALVVVTAFGAFGCASTPAPRELMDARMAYQQAQASPAASLTPAELLSAKQALDRAEAAFNEEPESQEVRDLAYIAQRRAQRAAALGSISYASRQIEQARRDFMLGQAELQQRTAQELSQTRQQLTGSQRQIEVSRELIATERLARIQAEQRAKEAMSSLASIAAIREDKERGTVITLSGAVVFASNQATLLPNSQDKLNQVAEALKEQGDDQMIVIEGHTDSRGPDAANQELSQRRAQAVRDYLVARGVPAERVRAMGIGESRPVADNDTAEGRANNRRVEIVIQPKGSASGATGASGQTKASEPSPYD